MNKLDITSVTPEETVLVSTDESVYESCSSCVENRYDAGQNIEPAEASPSRSHFGQSVIIVENSNDLNMDDLEPSLLKCMKQVMEHAEGEHSFMIVDGSRDCGESSEEQTTYIIDLNSLGKQANTSRKDQYDPNDKLVIPISSEIISTTSNISKLPSTPAKASYVHYQNVTKDTEHVSSSASFLDFQEQVEISFISCPSQIDLNDPRSDGEVSIEIVCTQNESAPSQTPFNDESLSRKLSVMKKRGSLSVLSRLQPETTSTSSYSHSSTIIKAAASTSKSSPQTESHLSTECLLHMKNNINDDKTHSRKVTKRQQSNSNETVTPDIEISKDNHSNSVITMYLSSPSDLKEMMKKLSPSVDSIQTGDDSSFDDNEYKENSAVSGDSFSKTHPQKNADIISTSNLMAKFSSDSFISMSSSSTATGVVYRCAECGYCSHNKHYYKQHVDLVHNEDRPYKCPHCDYAGKRRHALLEHLVVHSNQRPFTCDHCNASFRKKGHLTNHIKLHTSQRLTHCGVCNIQLPDTEAFESHLHKIHHTDKLYKCRLCDYTVVDKEIMLKHLHEHNEAIMYSCPKCPSLFNDEDNLLHHMKGNHHFSFVQKSTQKSDEAGHTCMIDGVGVPQPTSIICSECGFVCKDTEMMQKHMWIHIKKEAKQNTQINDKTKVTPVIKEESCSTLGVLKMNVDIGQKTLPKDVVYQCSSCSFTSSDNSVFIKHMLAHKTQEKRHNADLSKHTKFANEDNQNVEALSTTSELPVSKIMSYHSDLQSNPQVRQESGVPFIYDKVSSRFRCVICGYHCEFQRTIKAHIWKHSGHQNIEYPTFDHLSSTKSNKAQSLTPVLPNKELFKQADSMHGSANCPTTAATVDVSMSASLPVLRTRSGDTVQLVPVNPLKTNYNPANIIQIKNNSIIVPADCGKTSATSRFLESIAFSDDFSQDVRLKDRLLERPSSTGFISVNVSEIKDDNSMSTSKSSNKTGTNEIQGMKAYTGAVKLEIPDQDDTRSSCDAEDRFSEPNVVVEVVDTIPSGSALTGMKSQQGSPRIPDFDGSTGEAKLTRPLRKVEERRSSGDSDTSVSECEKFEVDVVDNKALQLKSMDSSTDHHSYSTRLRCPTCDCLLMEDFKTHLLSCQRKLEDCGVQSLEMTCKSENKKYDMNLDEHDGADKLQLEDTDSIESSDEILNSSGSAGQHKSGICSSLLAVIEQLRERSRSESEEDKQGPPAAKKGGKKKMRQDDDGNLISIEDVQNIEKFSENGGEKFRCSLCHYSSHRICNIKLHMKTHRQKKPSECSLCDFSSSSPEALQEHMLKHCKVRTYPCKFCPQSFNHKSTLRAHLRAHKDQEPFLCAYCVYETTSPLEYREHMQVHSGCSSRLRCPGCDLILSNKEELTAHLLMCTGSTKKNRHLLGRDDRSEINVEQEYEMMDQKTQLDPSSTHHACVVHGCSFSSSNLKELQDHLSVHCNPSLLVCNLCDFKALHSRSLKSHMKRHANDQRYVQQPLEQYKCNLCGYVCHHLPSLKSHMWRHASDQSYSYEFTNDVINAAIDHDTRVDADGDADDPELLDRVINSERKILEGELTKFSRGDGQRPICWVTFRCCSCGFETINKAKLNIHMRSHSDIIQKALDIPRKSGNAQIKSVLSPLPDIKYTSKRSNLSAKLPAVPLKVMRQDETVPL